MVALKPESAVCPLLLLLLSPPLLQLSCAKLKPPNHGHHRGTRSERSIAAPVRESLYRPVQAGDLHNEALYPVQLTGSRPDDYFWSKFPLSQGAWIMGKDGASTDPTAYGAVSRTVPAQPFWNGRVQVRAFAVTEGVEGVASHAALFVRVVGGGGRAGPGSGRTLVFDNMRRMGLQGWAAHRGWWSVVVDVPGPPPPHLPEDACPADDVDAAVPAFIQFRFVLAAGRSRVMVDQVSLKLVRRDVVPATSDGMPPWEPPGPEFL